MPGLGRPRTQPRRRRTLRALLTGLGVAALYPVFLLAAGLLLDAGTHLNDPVTAVSIAAVFVTMPAVFVLTEPPPT